MSTHERGKKTESEKAEVVKLGGCEVDNGYCPRDKRILSKDYVNRGQKFSAV